MTAATYSIEIDISELSQLLKTPRKFIRNVVNTIFLLGVLLFATVKSLKRKKITVSAINSCKLEVNDFCLLFC